MMQLDVKDLLVQSDEAEREWRELVCQVQRWRRWLNGAWRALTG
jgi:hypothetical protein